MAFEARILGPVEASIDGHRVALGSPKQRAVFALLVLEAGRVVTTDRLVDELWGDRQPESPSSSLQVYVSRLRRSLRQDGQPSDRAGDGAASTTVRLLRRGGGYQLEVPESSVDAQRFADLVASGRSLLERRPPQARLVLEEALALPRGPALADVVGSLGSAGTAEARRLDDLRLVAQESRLQAVLAEGDAAGAAADAATLVRAHPFREGLRGLLMLALYRAGRQSDALRAYDEVRAELAEELGVDPGADLRELHARILRHDPELDRPGPGSVRGAAGEASDTERRAAQAVVPGVATGRLPEQLTSLVGREVEIDEVLGAVGEARLTSLVGTGGSGKTRLAVAVADRARSRFPGGVCWVDVSSLDDPAVLPRVVAAALGGQESPERPPLEAAVEHVRDRVVLLVLDGCEHLAAACADAVVRVLTGCPGLRALVTSREPLAVPGELVWPVAPLDLPPEDGLPSREVVAGSAAVRLFCERAAGALRGFVLDEDNVGTVAHLCRRLDGLPLAIELAAARLRVLSLEEVADALDRHLEVLVAQDRGRPARHRTLRATVEWSHRLLSEEEQLTLARLSVFHGGFTLDAAASLRPAEPGDRADPADSADSSTLEVVSGLVDRSLVTVADRGRPTRYRLLETVRLYAAEQLVAGGRLEEARGRHLAHFLQLARTAEPRLLGPSQQEWLDLLDAEVADLLAALHWAVGEGAAPGAGLRLVSALWRFWYLRGHYAVGREWLDAALAASADAPPGVRVAALASAGRFAYLQCDYAVAGRRLEEALAGYRALGDGAGTAAVLQSLGCVAREQADYPRCRALHRDSRERWRRAGRADEVARSSNYLGFAAWLAAEPDEALEECAAALDHFSSAEDGEGRTWALIVQGAVAAYAGDPAAAGALLDEARRAAGQTGYREGVAWTLNLLGVVALREGDPIRARQLLLGSLRSHWQLGDRWRTASVLEALAAVESEPLLAGRLVGAATALRSRLGAPVPAVEQADLERLTTGLAARLGAAALAAAVAEGGRTPLPQAVERLLAVAP